LLWRFTSRTGVADVRAAMAAVTAKKRMIY